MTTKEISLKTARLYIDQLDLNYIIDAMCSENYVLPRWERKEALQCLKLYKNFILLQKKHYLDRLVPTREIDEFWHNHILFTRKYLQDCLNIFGHYLHHEPALPTDDSSSLIQDYLKTKQYYLAEFGESLELIMKK